MPFLERIENNNLPLILSAQLQQALRGDIEDPRAVEAVEQLVEDSDAVVLSPALNLVESEVEEVPLFEQNQLQIDLLLSAIANETVDRTLLDLPPLESYRVMDRLHRLPLYGTLVVDVYI